MSVSPPQMWAHHVHSVAVQEFLCWEPFEIVHELLFVEQESLQPTAEGATAPHATLVHLIQLLHLCRRKNTSLCHQQLPTNYQPDSTETIAFFLPGAFCSDAICRGWNMFLDIHKIKLNANYSHQIFVGSLWEKRVNYCSSCYNILLTYAVASWTEQWHYTENKTLHYTVLTIIRTLSFLCIILTIFSEINVIGYCFHIMVHHLLFCIGHKFAIENKNVSLK